MKKFTSLLMIVGFAFFGNVHAMNYSEDSFIDTLQRLAKPEKTVLFDFKSDAEKIKFMQVYSLKETVKFIGKSISDADIELIVNSKGYLDMYNDKEMKEQALRTYKEKFPSYFNLTQTLVGGTVIVVGCAYAAYAYFSKKSDTDEIDED